MTEDIVDKLRKLGGGVYLRGTLCSEAADEIEKLRRWKDEAIIVLQEWNQVWEIADCPGSLGESIASATAEEIKSLHNRITWHENPHHGCTCRWTKDDHSIKPECLYHRWAAEHPCDHRSPWNCPTFYDGCNCKAVLDQLDPEVKREMISFAEEWTIARSAAEIFRENDELYDENERLKAELDKLSEMFENVMNSLNCDYEDMFPG